MKKYSKYKDTNIEWIGEIPEHWEVKRMKNIGELYSGLSGKSGKDFKQPDNPNNKPYIPFSNIANNEKIDPDFLDYVVMKEDDNQNEVQKGDLFFLMSSENYDDVGKSSYLESELGEAYLNSFCKGFRMFEKSVDPSFLNWLLLSQPHRCRLMIEANGFTRINLKQDKIRDFYIYTPPLSEQTHIASYLDNKTSLIDKLINNNKKLIKLLEEKRTALINKVITKGLAPNVKMKDSGIEWIGEIPEHWEVKRLKWISKIGTGFTPPTAVKEYFEEGDVNWFTPSDFDGNGCILSDSKRKITLKAINDKGIELLPPGTLYFIGIGATAGKIAITRTESYANQQLNFISINQNPEYYFYLFLLAKNYIFETANFATLPIINQSQLSSIAIVVPPEIEQKNIITYLEEKIPVIDKLVKKIERENNHLKEYRQSLISNVVTGKINVQDNKNN